MTPVELWRRLTIDEPLSARLDRHRPSVLLERLRKQLDIRAEADMLALARGERDVCWLEPDDETEPLVTVRIPTHGRGPLVAERAIASALRQTYSRVEVLVVGDACDRVTVDAVKAIKDPRVRFINLPRQGLYPTEPTLRWLVAGGSPMNVALYLARGSWLALCDDDDELMDDHVEKLLGAAKRHRLEMVYGQATCEVRPAEWSLIGEWPLKKSRVSHGAVLYSLGLRFMTYDSASWRRREPHDWNLLSRMQGAGVRIGFVPQVVYRHYLEAGRRRQLAEEEH